MNLDEIDIKIIRILEENARTSFRKIAMRLGLSPMTIVKRIKRLEKNGIIKKYTVTLDPNLMGYVCSLCILVRVKAGYDPENIGKKISEYPQTYMVNVIAGDHDLAIISRCRNRNELKMYLSLINQIEGVERVNSYFVIKSIV